MKDILISDIVCMANGRVLSGNGTVDENGTLSPSQDDYISNITTSSQEVEKGSLFIAIRGGHKFVQDAIDNGAICCLVEEKLELDSKGCTIIYVESTEKATIELAKFYRSLFNIPAIAITGSNGKTSTKDTVASVLSEKYNVLKTEGNFNNEIGVPITIFKIREHHEVIVIEMGMNHSGEIERLVDIVKPNMAIITNIGVAHIEYLGSKEGILNAKMEITKGLKFGGMLILNQDDEMLSTIKKEDYPNFEIVTYGKSQDADFVIENIIADGISQSKFDVRANKTVESYTLNYPGEFMVYNALCGIICGDEFAMDSESIRRGVANLELSKNRLDKFTLSCGTTVINDAYNASPDSMRAAISIFDDVKDKRKILCLGDMFELGENSQRMHRELGEYLATKDIDNIVFVGDMMKNTYLAYTKLCDNNCVYVSGIDEILPKLNTLNLNEEDVLLFKASNGMKFRNVISEIKEKL